MLRIFAIGLYIAVGIRIAHAQQMDRMPQDWKDCADSPTVACIVALARAGTPAIIKSMVGVHLIDAGYADDTIRKQFPLQALGRRIADSLKQSKREGKTAAQARAKLLRVERAFPSELRLGSRRNGYFRVYEIVAERILNGVPSEDSPQEGAIGDAERVAHQRHALQKYGAALDAFIQRWKELAVLENREIAFADKMLQLGRKADALWALQQSELNPRKGYACRTANLWLALGNLAAADNLTKDTPCYRQRAEIAMHYAQSGAPKDAKRVAYALLKDLPAYFDELKSLLDGPLLIDTVKPLIVALSLAGDRERALEEIKTYHAFIREAGGDRPGFAGLSFGFRHIPLLLYAIGEEKKADLFVDNNELKPAQPNWETGFTVAFTKCQLGKKACLDQVLHFSNQPLDYSSASFIYETAIKAKNDKVTPEYIYKKFGYSNAFKLYYNELSRAVLTGSYSATEDVIKLLIAKERRHSDAGQPRRYIFMLRLAVAMQRKILAKELVRLIILTQHPAAEPKAHGTSRDQTDSLNAFWAWDSPEGNRVRYLAETAAVFAQLQ